MLMFINDFVFNNNNNKKRNPKQKQGYLIYSNTKIIRYKFNSSFI